MWGTLTFLLKDGRESTATDFFGLCPAAGWMRADIEPDLQDVGNRYTIADDRAAKNRLPEDGNPRVNVRFLFGALGRETHVLEHLTVEIFDIEIRCSTVYESATERLCRGKRPVHPCLVSRHHHRSGCDRSLL
ncbi:hypothetical protein SBA2_300018 [Acidobacteriia bacterium SbA2]|nr:hypothetical protein SBA2_300018 [Acidobacteriia bacterium SbA2]